MDKKALKKLQSQWYKKLEQSGFKDIEQEDGKLKTWASSFQLHISKDQYLERTQYYSLASQLLYEDVFLEPKDKVIWEMHCNGSPIKAIAKAVKCTTRTIDRRLYYYNKYIKV